MDYKIDNFIGVFENVLSSELCNYIIGHFENLQNLNLTLSRQTWENASSIHKDNSLVFTNRQNISEALFNISTDITKHFVDSSWECYKIYAKQYGVLSSLRRHIFYDDVKIQKTLPTQGYHVWHCEQADRSSSPRLLLVLAYLNDVEEGGETEFLYQSRRIKPKQGTILICPCGFTHTHRGNPPLSGVKYVMNGWIEFCE